MKNTIGVFSFLVFCGLAFSEGMPKLPVSCENIRKACEQSGSKYGQRKQGKGMDRHCLGPLLHGTKADGALPLPKVSPKDIELCKKEGPSEFGKIKPQGPTNSK